MHAFLNIRCAAIATAALLLATAVGMGPGAAGQKLVFAPKAAGSAAINCSVPNNVVCTVTSAKGLKSVKIFTNAMGKTIAIVDKSYNNCPRSVKVSWDSAYQQSGQQIVECAALGLKAR